VAQPIVFQDLLSQMGDGGLPQHGEETIDVVNQLWRFADPAIVFLLRVHVLRLRRRRIIAGAVATDWLSTVWIRMRGCSSYLRWQPQPS